MYGSQGFGVHVYSAGLGTDEDPDEGAVTATIVTSLFSTHHFSGTDSEGGLKIYDPRVNAPLRIVRTIFSGGNRIGGFISMAGRIEINNNDGALDLYQEQFGVVGRSVIVRMGEVGASYGAFRSIFEGTVNGWSVDESKLVLTIKDKLADLDVPIQSNLYTGTGGLEGGADLANKAKPICFGQVFNIPAVLIDSGNLIYQVHDGPIISVDAVFDRGVALDKVASPPGVGQFSQDISTGTFTLGGIPTGTITADVKGSSFPAYEDRTGDVIERMLIEYGGLSLSDFDNAAMNLAKGFGLISDDVSIVGFQQTINCREIWEKVLESEVSSFESDFLEREVQQIILHHDITDEHAYMRQTRIGMGMPVSRRQRIEIWDLYKKYRDYKRQNNLVDRLELFNKVASHINQNPGLRPYRHVILDEVQDCSNVEIRFFRSLVDEGVNDMFLVGDPYQSIYQRRVVFSQAGVNIRGRRSRKLKVNYRTTEEIKRFAVAALQGIKYNDFDESEEELKGYVSIFHGQIPEYRIFDSENDELDFILEQVNELVDRGAITGFSDVVVAARTRNAYRRYIGMLHRRNIPYYDLREESGSPDGLHLCTFHSLKGLEYKVVFLADINERTCPNIPKRYQGWNEDEKEIYLNSERSLLYTAMTRAIKGLWITGVGKKTQWIGKTT